MIALTNAEVARVLNEMADLMEIADGNPFRVRSYRRAAEAVENMAEEITRLHAEDALESISGVGKGLAEKIAEFLETGEIGDLQALLQEYPETLLELLKIPGLGPKRAGQIFRELGIATVDDLERAARAGNLRELEGLGAKSEEKLLRGVGVYRQGQERRLLDAVLPVAQEMLEELRGHADVLGAEMAGSARRGRETIGDLDLLATSEAPGKVCRAFQEDREVIAAGDTKVSVRMSGGLNVDLRVVPPESYGAALVYFTGSKQHNVDLRERAQNRGLTLNEYGLFEEAEGEKGRRVAGETEEEVYRALDLAWIPPELRESRGELAAAEEDRLPRLITLEDIRCDLQMHTTGSDGHDTLEEMARACRDRGYSHMGVTDHSPALTVAGGQSGEQLREQIAEVRRLNEQAPKEGDEFTILAGIEADILPDGSLDIPEGLYEELDFVIGSIHQGFSADADRITGRILKAFESGRMDILAHPTGRILLGREAYGIHVEEVISVAVEHDIALEINASPQRLDLNDTHARLAAERGAKLTINTDAHHAEHLDFMQYGVVTARRGWIEAPTVINAWTLEDLRQWLKGRRGEG